MNVNKLFVVAIVVIMFSCSRTQEQSNERESASAVSKRIPVLFDTDANNELDDQHALAYLFFNSETFDIRGVTVNATFNGGEIDEHYDEAERIMKLCAVLGEIPLIAGANGDFEDIRGSIQETDYDGKAAVEFIIAEAREPREDSLYYSQ